ncbi:MAG: chitobiase/beta-hexosaminidase C-terminal domain-containing protein [Clostridiales bacterium]|uniref:FN3 associated domain-containing protein n=1 Tax=Chordicoccus furentiruminis TaxID=2709410 RepID=UPI0023A80BFD|nr:FN3 associated domain-containing protein [Chordicoccus furentiruminis]MCI6173170.1 chitobiase/beta-hexosaminidase C-terminal domain-containing protein [Clostridiales bacterium]
MKCSNCGFEIPDGKLYCPRCGKEVQLVPDFTSVSMERERLLRARAEEERRRREAEAAESERRVRPLVALFKTAMTVIIAAGLTFLMHYYLTVHESETFSGQRLAAINAYEAHNLKTAQSAVSRALELRPRSTEMAILKADILTESGRISEALSVLEDLIESEPDEISAWEKLIGIRIEEGDNTEVARLVEQSRFESLTEKYADYLADPPTFSLINGRTYPYGTSLTIRSASGTIYYTTDGSVPDAHSTKYTGPIPLDAGTNRIAAVCINSKGVASKTVKAVYNIRKAE